MALCHDCAPKPDPALQHYALQSFVGRHVKLAFPATDGVGEEHMWVKVTHVLGHELVGWLDNDPVLDVGLVEGDTVAFLPTSIEAVVPGFVQ